MDPKFSQIYNKENKVKVFTTRPDTIFGASFIALSCDHPLSKEFINQKEFIKFTQSKFWNFTWKGKNIHAFYGIREMSAIGWHGKNMFNLTYEMRLLRIQTYL